ncbi:MAG: radical SAM protein [Candidatus Aenigmarchaeota archaeon]|nr:radical SAM protein [Candidatus Aenigmarchaeota archaeon]
MVMTKILLVEPPAPKKHKSLRVLGSVGSLKANMIWPPYDHMLIGGLLRKNGIYDFDIIDAQNLNITYPQLKNMIRKARPEFVVFTTTNHSLPSDLNTAKVAKQVDKNIKTAAIGLSIQAIKDLDNVMKKNKDLDFIVYNEAEYPVLNLIKNNYNPKDVLGIYYRKGGKIVKNKPQPPIDYDSLGIPAQDKIPLEIYKDPLMERKPFTLVCNSRGCVGSCIHCSSFPFQRPLRHRSIDNVIEELRLIKRLGVKEIKFFDNCFTGNPKWTEKFLKRMIEEDFNFTWLCDVRADCTPMHLLKLMKKAGCHTIMMGGDSADQKVLDSMHKRQTVKQVEDAVKRIKSLGFKLLLYFEFGYPAETKETMEKTIEFAKRMDPDMVTFAVVTPVYKTQFYDFLEKNNYLDKSANIEKYDTIKPPVYNYPHLSAEEIYAASTKGYREFYLRPKFILKRLKNSPSLKDDIENFKMFMKQFILRN